MVFKSLSHIETSLSHQPALPQPILQFPGSCRPFRSDGAQWCERPLLGALMAPAQFGGSRGARHGPGGAMNVDWIRLDLDLGFDLDHIGI